MNINKISLAVVIAIVATFGMLTTSTTIQRAMGTSITTNTTLPLSLGNPYYVEYDKTTSQKAVVINGTTHATQITFSGHGMAKDVNITDNGKALIIPRDTKGSAVLLQGNVNLISSSGDKASLDIKELGHMDPNGAIKANGAAFFDANATGRLSYLGNTVSIYTDQVDKTGNGKVLAWEWNK
jgi:hypothetical protein